MRTKAICELVQLPEQKFFEEVATGLQHVAANGCSSSTMPSRWLPRVASTDMAS